MILTKAKEDELTTLLSGITSYAMELGTSFGNYWVDWAYAFVNLCQSKLGLEVESGPGTSIGRIQAEYGPTRYQYDCDWTKENGRVDGFLFEEKGFTAWEDIEPWTIERYPNGIDTNNRRFDFIVWFTTESSDSRTGKAGERLGLRFKYPLINERGFNCAYYISTTPFCQPWYKNNTIENLERFNYRLGDYNGRIGTIPLNDDTKNSYLKNINGLGAAETTKSAVWTILDNQNWSHYIENAVDEKTEAYAAYGGDYSSYSPAYYRTLGLNNFQYIVSKNKSTIDLRVKDNNGRIVFDIVYGNLMEEQITEDNIVTNSFVMVIGSNNYSYMANFLMTENGIIINPTKQVNRPTTLNTDRHMYWGVSRLLLDKQYIHCADLYQVFSFTDLMNNNDYAEKVFVDKNNEEHKFVMFNFGDCSSSTNCSSCVALAMPI